ncbi:MAG: hypothetical protein CL457_04910 [Acidimicrobiaceae bacterium]|nr:hypothetical protein [Acidimicrobiaceae bacterium]|tara:strand:+ start:6364 stop:8175 length:1812 start_codon:yes stop_codon:yes gene_type:complete
MARVNFSLQENWRLVVLIAFFFISAVGLGWRLFYIQVLTSDQRVQKGVDQRMYESITEGERGRILDRNGAQLAMSFPQPIIHADPKVVGELAIEYAQILEPIINRESKYILAELTRETRYSYLQREATLQMQASVEDLDLVGVYIDEEPRRHYLSGSYFARGTIGQAGVDNQGVSGIELQYDEYLAGESGLEVAERNLYGGTIPNGRIQIEPATRGADIYLTLDRALQAQVELELSTAIETMSAKGGVVIISKPATGEILSMASMVTTEDGEIVTTSDNRAATWVYEPGSVMKSMTFAAVVNEGLAHPNTVRAIDDSIELFDEEECVGVKYDCTFTELGLTYGTREMTLEEILVNSSNTGTITWALDLGKERLHRYLIDFGFNQKTDLDFPYEASGVLKSLENWSGVEIATTGMGQGIDVTPIQMLSAYNALANGGVYVSPQIISSIAHSSGEKEYVATSPSRRVIGEQAAREMTQMLAAVVSRGTARKAGVPGYAIAAKTGTARKVQPNGTYEDEEGLYRYASTVVGYFPASAPELSMIVIIDEPADNFYASETAAPLFGDLASWTLRHYKISPSSDLVYSVSTQGEISNLTVDESESEEAQ